MVAEGLRQIFAQMHPAHQPAVSGAGSELVPADWSRGFLLHRPQRAVRAFPLKLEVARQLSVNTASTEIVTCLHGSSLGLCCPKAGCANAFCVAPTMRMGAQSLISRFFFALFLYPGHPLGPTVEIGTFFQIP